MEFCEEVDGNKIDQARSNEEERIKSDALQETTARGPDRPNVTNRDQVGSSDISEEGPKVFEVKSDEQPAANVKCGLTSNAGENPANIAISDVIQEALTNGVVPKPPETKKPQRDNLSRIPRNRTIHVRKDELENDDGRKIHFFSNSVATLPDPEPTLPISSNDNCSTTAALSEPLGEVESRIGDGDALEYDIKQKGEERCGNPDQSTLRATDESFDRSSSVPAGQNYCQSNSTKAKTVTCKPDNKEITNMDIYKTDVCRAKIRAKKDDLKSRIQTPLPPNDHSDYAIRSSLSDTALVEQKAPHWSHSDTILTTRNLEENVWEMFASNTIRALKSPTSDTSIEKLQTEFKTGSLEEFEKLEEMLNRSPDNLWTSLAPVGIEPVDPLKTNKQWSTVKIRSREDFEKLESTVCKSPDNRRTLDFRETKELLIGDNGNGNQTGLNANKSRKVTTPKNLSTNCLLATKKTPIHLKQLADGVTTQRGPKSAGRKEVKTSPSPTDALGQNDKVPNQSSRDQKKASKDQFKTGCQLEQTGNKIPTQSDSKSFESTSESGRNSQATEYPYCDVDTKEFLAKIKSHKKTFRHKTPHNKSLKMSSVTVMEVIKEGKVKMFASRFHRETDQDWELKILIREARTLRQSCRAFKYRGARLIIEQEMKLKGSSIPVVSKKRHAHKTQKPSKIPVPIQSFAKSRPAGSKANAMSFDTKQKLIFPCISLEGRPPSKIPILNKMWIRKSIKPDVTSFKRSRIPVKRRPTLKGKVGKINITGLKIKRGDHVLLGKGLDIGNMRTKHVEELEHEGEHFKKPVDNRILGVECLDIYWKDDTKTSGGEKDMTLFEGSKCGFVAELFLQEIPALPQQNPTKQNAGRKTAQSITSPGSPTDVSPVHVIANQVKTTPVATVPNQITVHQEPRRGSQKSSSCHQQQNGCNDLLANGEPSTRNATPERPSYKKAVAWEINWTDYRSPKEDKQKLSWKTGTSSGGAELSNIRPILTKSARLKSERPVKKSVSFYLPLAHTETKDEETQNVLRGIGISNSDAEVDTNRTVAKTAICPELKPQASNSSLQRIQGTSQNKEVVKLPPLINSGERSVFYSFRSKDDKNVACQPVKKTEERIALPKIKHTPSLSSASVDRCKAAVRKDILPNLPEISNFSNAYIQGISRKESNVPKLPKLNQKEDKFVPCMFKDNVDHEKMAHSSVQRQEKDPRKFNKTRRSRNVHVERMKAGQEKRRQKAAIPIPWFHRD